MRTGGVFCRFLTAIIGLATAWQVHGDDIKTVSSAGKRFGNRSEIRRLISGCEGILIGVKTADCVPVLIGDPKTRAFAAVHAGWRGTVQSIVVKAIEKMKAEYGTDPADLICAIGPAATCQITRSART